MPDTSPEAAPTTPPTSEPHDTTLAGRPGGFPSSTDYLPEGMNHRTATHWPAAQNQLKAFFAARDRANDKLVHSSRLPEVLKCWWVRSWAGEFLFRTVEGINASVADVRALYEFGRKLDQLVRLTGTPPGDHYPRDAEFTYYVHPFLREGPNGTAVPEPFATWKSDYRIAEQNSPTRFPRMSVRDPSTRVCLRCHEFLEWGAFLAAPDALTPQQREELGHVAYSGSGIRGWCDFGSTFGEVWGTSAGRIIDRLRDAVVVLSDSLHIGVQTVPQELPFADALALVSQWLVTAEDKSRIKVVVEAVANVAPKAKEGEPPANRPERMTLAEDDKQSADDFAELRQFARNKLKGQERAVVEALCDSGGELPIANLAIRDGVSFNTPDVDFKNVQRRLTPKLKRQMFLLSRQDNAARLVRIPEAPKRV